MSTPQFRAGSTASEPAPDYSPTATEPDELHATSEPEGLHSSRAPVIHTKGAEHRPKPRPKPEIHRLLPQSADAEKGIIGSFLLAPREVGALCVRKGIYPGHFHIPTYRLVFDFLLEMHHEHEPIDIITLTQRLKDAGQLEAAGGPGEISELFTFLPTAANVETYIETLEEKYVLREIVSMGHEAVRRGHEEQDNLPTLLADLGTRVTALAQSRKTKSIRELLAERAFDVDNPPPPEPAIFGLAGVEICHAGNLTVIEAHVKAGKSATIGGGLASTFASLEADCLGWRSDGNPKGYAVLHFDTEQSRGDHYNLICRALARDERSRPPAWLQSFCFTGVSLAELHLAIETAIADSVAKFGGVHSIWLDGGADLVKSPNDEEEAFTFVRQLQGRAISLACPIIVVLHLNPGDTGKSRGHLGSELNRKAETVLRVTKDEHEVSKVETKWFRHAPIPAKDAPCFAWSDEQGRHVSIATERRAEAGADMGANKKLVAAVWRGNPGRLIKYEELVLEVMRRLEISKSTAKRKIGSIQELNLVEKAPGGIGYILTEEGSKCCEPDER